MIIAKINDEYEISKKEYELEVKKLQNNYELDEIDEKLKHKAINNLIDGYVLLKIAGSSDIKITEEELINEEIDYKTKFSGFGEFHKSLEDLGIDENSLKDRLKDKILVKKYINKFCACKNNVSEDKLKKMYEKNIAEFKTPEKRRAYHILINESETAFEEISKIKKSLKTKNDFIELIKKHCPEDAICDKLDFISKGKMLKEFDNHLFSLTKDEISEPFKTKFGYHILMVDEIQPGRIAKFDEIKDSLCSRLGRIESELKLLDRIKETKKELNIEIKEENL